MAITEVDGCILEAFDKGEINVMLHCVNMMGRMNSGLAKDIKAKYPKVFEEYLKKWKHGRNLSGQFQRVSIIRPDIDLVGNNCATIVNVFGQNMDLTEFQLQNPDVDISQSPPRLMNYGYLSNAFATMNFDNEFSRSDRIGIPYNFACGLAGGDWTVVKELIEFHLGFWDVFIYKKPE